MRRSRIVVRRRSVRIRPARPEDSLGIWRVVQAAVTTLAGTYTQQQMDAWIADEAAQTSVPGPAPGRIVLVAESQGHVVAFSRLRWAELEALYVHPAWAGHRIGQLLLRATEKSASVRRVHTVSLDAALNAVRFYASAGYQVVCPSRPVFDNGVALPCWRMQKNFHTSTRCLCQPRDHSILPVAASGSASPSSLPSVLSRRML
jgi:GNAT superfamily N-acetyltransferase